MSKELSKEDQAVLDVVRRFTNKELFDYFFHGVARLPAQRPLPLGIHADHLDLLTEFEWRLKKIGFLPAPPLPVLSKEDA